MRKWGDRRDAVRVRNLDGMHHYMAYLMPKRTDAEVYINETIDVTELLRYIAEKNASGERKVTLFHCFHLHQFFPSEVRLFSLALPLSAISFFR